MSVVSKVQVKHKVEVILFPLAVAGVGSLIPVYNPLVPANALSVYVPVQPGPCE